MKFDTASRLEELIWASRQADLPRAENRAVLQRLYNGEPPYDITEAEEANVQVNRNFLEGTNILSQARRQWHNAFLKQGNFFQVTVDYGKPNQRREWSTIITREINKRLKRNSRMREQARATGANVVLHGIGAVNWPDRKTTIPTPLPVASLLIPSDTDIDFDNLEWFAVFREWTPAQLYDLTHGEKVDPGWNMPLVRAQLKYVGEQQQKVANATSYQYSPEKIEEAIKQDSGYWGSDAVPTIDVWDVYFLEEGKWYRRVLLDWGSDEGDSMKSPPKGNNDFLYTSGNREYAEDLCEIIHVNFGDCSAVAPFKYHSVRSLGWMLWGVCELMNRMRCRFTEQVLSQFMWFFRVASHNDFSRINRADFFHMGVIPSGVSMVLENERFKPDANLVEMGFSMNRQLMSENAASFTQDFDKGGSNKEMTATETMARVNNTNSLVSGMLTLAYDYEETKYREICRRFCIADSKDKDAEKFRKACKRAGVPEEALDVELWDVKAERVLGGGNKTLEMAEAQALMGIRQNLGPDAQRDVDHIYVNAVTDDPALAERLAPVEAQQEVSKSMHDAQLATERLMRGLQFTMRPDMVFEDYVMVWLDDMATIIGTITQRGNMATMEEITGLNNIGQHVSQLLEHMGQNEADVPKVKEYSNALGQLMNAVKGFEQRLMEQQKQAAQAGVDGAAASVQAETQAKLQQGIILAEAKAENQRQAHAEKTAQRQAQFELEQQRKDREQQAELRRKDMTAMNEVQIAQFKAANEPKKPAPTPE